MDSVQREKYFKNVRKKNLLQANGTKTMSRNFQSNYPLINAFLGEPLLQCDLHSLHLIKDSVLCQNTQRLNLCGCY